MAPMEREGYLLPQTIIVIVNSITISHLQIRTEYSISDHKSTILRCNNDDDDNKNDSNRPSYNNLKLEYTYFTSKL